MGKRSSFTREARDLYRTFDPAAVAPLLPHLKRRSRYIEPCAGAGDLVRLLDGHGHLCVYASDIVPLIVGIDRRDALAEPVPAMGADLIVTNPPWSRKLLHAMIVAFSDVLPTWLLFDADWFHTKQARPFLSRLRKMVSVGRVKWIAGSKGAGKDNCAWYLFDKPSSRPPLAYGRLV